ncbi:hypothetical protein CAPTEDRAFT_212894 [Capitella teleta]|uniref:Gfo/Idh/MocA-like oxidoreductase N-terminal domain-containing protein n=1 Tax=Capitella teleta TaxID=283909 RepID=R7TPC9_CAPTE|nr:hypothetical protein CAPTEDRAFT_212894 [Capitella teleta]|eukprot:ELT93351.1 hypothetical protein CAPTEDRAFT_212894 [Capitella teleta]
MALVVIKEHLAMFMSRLMTINHVMYGSPCRPKAKIEEPWSWSRELYLGLKENIRIANDWKSSKILNECFTKIYKIAHRKLCKKGHWMARRKTIVFHFGGGSECYLGIAGKLRVRDLKTCQKYESTKRLQLIGYVSRRSLFIEGASPISLDEALARENVHMAIICTETNQHEAAVRKCILAKKHVCVQSPMTLTAKTSKEMIASAEENGDVSLLGPAYQELVKNLEGRIDDVKSSELVFTGRFNGWVEDFKIAGTPFTSNVDNVHNLLDLFGNLTPVEASIQRIDDEIVAEAEFLSTKGMIPIRLRVVRRRTIEHRGKIMTVQFKDGAQIESILSAPSRLDKGAYMADLEMFTETVTGKRDSSRERWLCIRGLEVADQLNMMAKANSKSVNFNQIF